VNIQRASEQRGISLDNFRRRISWTIVRARQQLPIGKPDRRIPAISVPLVEFPSVPWRPLRGQNESSTYNLVLSSLADEEVRPLTTFAIMMRP